MQHIYSKIFFDWKSFYSILVYSAEKIDMKKYMPRWDINIRKGAGSSFKCFGTTVALVYYCTDLLKDSSYRDHRDVSSGISYVGRKDTRIRKTRNSAGSPRLTKKRANSLPFCQTDIKSFYLKPYLVNL